MICELYIDGKLIGVFSTNAAAIEFAEENHPEKSYSIFPIGTTIATDIKPYSTLYIIQQL